MKAGFNFCFIQTIVSHYFWGDFHNIRLDMLGTRVLWSLLEAHPNEIQSIRTSSPINCEFMNVNLALPMRN